MMMLPHSAVLYAVLMLQQLLLHHNVFLFLNDNGEGFTPRQVINMSQINAVLNTGGQTENL